MTRHQRHRHTAGSGHHKTTSPHDPPARHLERFECYMVDGGLTICSEDEVHALLEENIKKKRQLALWDQSKLPLAGAFVEAADMLDDNLDDGLSHDGLSHDGLSHDGLSHDGLSHDGTCYAAIPDLHGARISAHGICPMGQAGMGIFKTSQFMGRGSPQLWRDLYFFEQKENHQPRQINLSEVLAVPRPHLADPNGCFSALLTTGQYMLTTGQYMTNLCGKQYATKALCGK